MTFHEFLISKFPLYADPDIKVNLSVKQLVQLVVEYNENCNKSNLDNAVVYVQNTHCNRYLHDKYMLIGDVRELIKITTCKDVQINDLIK